MATDLNLTAVAQTDERVPIPDTEPGESTVLHGISWKSYRKLRKMPENRNVRMTYDQGELEIMSPSAVHEKIAALLGDLILVWRLELRIRVVCCRTMTIRKSVLDRGFEPDNCYYVRHEPQVWNKKKIDFKTDPPPDLAVEVEVSRKVLNKMKIYASFGVPELWCWTENVLKVFELGADGNYSPRESSICFPGFPLAKAEETIRQLATAHDTDLILSFRDWVRANALPNDQSNA